MMVSVYLVRFFPAPVNNLGVGIEQPDILIYSQLGFGQADSIKCQADQGKDVNKTVLT